jgi:serine/threonine protein kinase
MLKKGYVVETIFDEYKVVSQINQGGNGTVFKVQNSDGQLLALKAIDRNLTSKDKLKRFKNKLVELN